MTNDSLKNRRSQAVTPAAASVHPLYVQRGEGSFIYDVEGNEYLDFTSGIAVTSLGHSHPRVMAAVQKQAAEFQHLCFAVSMHPTYIELAERLNASAPGSTPKKSFLVNTGAEAVENAIKIARYYTKRTGIVAFTHAFHGRTFMAMTLTNRPEPYKSGFVTRANDVYRAQYPYAFRNPWGATTEEEVGERALAALKEQVKYSIGENEVAAFIIEPVAGEGGFIPAPANFLKGLAEYAKEIGALWIDDEVQTGVGRTGKMWTVEHYGLEPDLITSAKALGSGFPIGAVTGKAHIMDAMHPGSLGTTFGGNPTAAAAAIATLDVMSESGFLERVVAMGDKARARLEALAEGNARIGEVRGRGIMLAIEFVGDDGFTPDSAAAEAVVAKAREDGLLLLSTGTFGNVIRLLPPLNLSDDELEEGLSKIEEAVTAVTGREPALS